VDESTEQTGRIHRVQRERTLAGLVAREERQDLLKKLRNAQRLLQPVHVLNPYAPDLTFVKERTRHRRDNEKYLTLIDAITLLHQHQRRRGHHTVSPGQPGQAGRTVEFIEVTLDDIALTNQLAAEMLGRSLDELPPQTRRLLGYNPRTGEKEMHGARRENICHVREKGAARALWLELAAQRCPKGQSFRQTSLRSGFLKDWPLGQFH